MAPKILISFLYVVITCVMFTMTNTFSIPMIPIDSPKLQMFPQSLTTEQRHQLLTNITMSRASLLVARQNSNSSHINSIKGTVAALLSSLYVIQIFFGTRNHVLNAYLLLDSGARNTWVQCRGCDPCIKLHTDNIDPHTSLTYKIMSLNDGRCKPKFDYKGTCGYQNKYGANAVSEGQVGTDTFTFINAATKQPQFFKNIAFGCGYKNQRFSFLDNDGPNNLIAGIFGLIPGPISFVTQLYDSVKGRFSYCLTSWAERARGTSTIHFGDDAKIGGQGVQQIALHLVGGFQLSFTGISVEGQRLPIDISRCQVDPRRTDKGFFIDSGAPYTLLPSAIYHPFKAAMVAFFSWYKWPQVVYPLYDLCYATPGPTTGQRFPNVKFHFQRAGGGPEVSWEMTKNNMFVEFERIHGFCMVVKEIDNRLPCIFGAYQHADFRVLYDYNSIKRILLNDYLPDISVFVQVQYINQ